MKLPRFSIVTVAGLALLQASPCLAETGQVYGPPTASEAVAVQHHEALMDLAKEFVKKVGQNLDMADAALEGKDIEDLRVQPYFDSIPDGEPLIMQISLLDAKRKSSGPGIELQDPVGGFKQGHDVMLSLSDFVAAANFAIRVDAGKETADGWYIREDRQFHLDLKAGKATSGDQAFRIAPEEAVVQDGDILIAGKTLAKWFGFRLVTNPQTQSMDIATIQSWPAQEKAARDQRKKSSLHDSQPQQPFRKEPYDIVAAPSNADIYLQHTVVRAQDEKSTGTSYSAQASGELLGHTARTTLTGTDEERLTSLYLNLSRTAADASLLGPLKARYYELNDISAVSVPLTGGGGQERGARVTNKDPYVTYDTTTQIEGDAPPGWDVELYRDESYIATLTAGDNGRYVFNDVTLFSGDNLFKIVSYGPQGERREETRTLSVSPSTFGGGWLYNVSVSEQQAQTYTLSPSNGPDAGALHMAATWQKQINHIFAVEGGVNSLQREGLRYTYTQAGVVAVWGDTVLNADTAVRNDGTYATSLTARRRIGDHRLSLSGQYDSENYLGSSVTGNVPASATVTANASGPLFDPVNKRLTYSVRSSRTQSGKNAVTTTSNASVTARLRNMSVSNALNYRTARTADGTDVPALLDGTLSLNGRMMGTAWRASANYRVKPVSEFTQYDLDLSRSLTENLYATATVSHDVGANYNTEQLALNWNTRYATISPTVSYNTDKTLALLLNVHVGLSRDPYSNDFAMSGSSVSDKGSVAAFVFLDNDGDNVFSKGDEPLEEATIESVQNRRIASTDKGGEAFLYGLPVNNITDIVVQDSSAFDINWVPAFPGVSIRPRAGHVTRINFPIHKGGEMDGTAWVRTEDGKTSPLRSTRLYLYDMDGRLAMTSVTAGDGYYVFEKIPPGRYYLLADPEDAEFSHILRLPPQRITVGYQGGIIASNDLYFESGEHDIPMSIAPDLSDWLDANPGADIAGMDKDSVILNLGSYHSQLLASVVWYKLKFLAGGVLGDAEAMVAPSDVNNSLKTGKNTLRARIPGDMTEAYRRCRALEAEGYYCEVEILPKGVQKQASAAPPARG